MAKRINFTKTTLGSLKPSEKVYSIYDTKTRGLCIVVSPSGGRVFYLYRKIQGRPERIRIGPFPDLSPSQARARAEQLNASIARGENPADKRRGIVAEMTLGQLLNQYLETKTHLAQGTRDHYGWVFQHLEHWTERKISTIRKEDVQRLFGKVSRTGGPYVANRMLALLTALYNLAQNYGFQGPNPAKGIKRNREQSRERFLNADELKRFFQALQQEPTDYQDLFLLCILTAQRSGNVRSMRFLDIDFERAVWTIPAPETKSRQQYVVPLIRPVLEILERRRSSSQGGFVFPANSKTGYITPPKSSWNRIVRRAELENVRPHDLRRTTASWAAALGIGLQPIQKMLGHADISTTSIYSRLDLAPVRMAIEASTGAILRAGRLLPEAEVIDVEQKAE